MAVTTAPADVVEAALAGRKELALIAEPSVAAVGAVLAARCRNPADPRGRRARRSRRPRRTAPAPRAARHRALTVDELLGVRVGDAGSLDAAGRLVPDLDAEPLALEYSPTEGGQRRLTFLSFEARAAVQERLAGGHPGPNEPLLLPGDAAAAASSAAAVRSAALISAGNDVNVSLCRATGDFFRAWGMPGARFDARRSAPPPDEEPT